MKDKPDDITATEYLKLWNVRQNLEFLRGIENYVYNTFDGKYFLRLSRPCHRTHDEIQNEAQWICDLSKSGFKVVQPIMSQNGNLVEQVNYNGFKLSAVLFEKASGYPLENEADYREELFFEWGKVTGKLHLYSQKHQTPKRKPWNEEPGFLLAKKELDPTKPHYEAFTTLEKYLHQLDKSPDCFGLIHADLHMGNFFVQKDNSLCLFDFDDSCYHWFAYDLATIQISLKHRFQRCGWKTSWQKLWDIFLNSYLKAYPLKSIWMQRIEAFSYWREVLLYFWIESRLMDNDFVESELEPVKQLQKEVSQSLSQFSEKILI